MTQFDITWYYIQRSSGNDESRNSYMYEVKEDTPYLTITCELWGAYHEHLGESYASIGDPTILLGYLSV